MKVGSLVICPNGIKAPNGIDAKSLPASEDIIYTVRDITAGYNHHFKWSKGIRLEEVKNGIAEDGNEWSYIIDFFREVQPPMDLSELMKESELLTLVNV